MEEELKVGVVAGRAAWGLAEVEVDLLVAVEEALDVVVTSDLVTNNAQRTQRKHRKASIWTAFWLRSVQLRCVALESANKTPPYAQAMACRSETKFGCGVPIDTFLDSFRRIYASLTLLRHRAVGSVSVDIHGVVGGLYGAVSLNTAYQRRLISSLKPEWIEQWGAKFKPKHSCQCRCIRLQYNAQRHDNAALSTIGENHAHQHLCGRRRRGDRDNCDLCCLSRAR